MSIRKEFRSINEWVLDIGQRKSRSAQYRSSGMHSVSESSRKVYLESCANIASNFSAVGYKYFRSRQQIVSLKNDLTFQVSFQSSHHNVPGEYVALSINVYVLSNVLKKWRGQQLHSIRQTDYVAGGQIGGLLDDPVWMEWNLANPKHRKASIKDAGSAIEKIAFPYFAHFEDIRTLIEKLQSQSFPAMDIGSTIEFLLCYGSSEMATTAGKNYLSHHPELINQFAKKISDYKEKGLPKFSGIGAIPELAFVSVAHDLSFIDST